MTYEQFLENFWEFASVGMGIVGGLGLVYFVVWMFKKFDDLI